MRLKYELILIEKVKLMDDHSNKGVHYEDKSLKVANAIRRDANLLVPCCRDQS
jgi:hypothetical protein